MACSLGTNRAALRQYVGADLEETQKGTMNVMPWMDWFLGCLERTIDGAETTLGAVQAKARFRDRLRDFQVNEGQQTVLNRLLDRFDGEFTTSK